MKKSRRIRSIPCGCLSATTKRGDGAFDELSDFLLEGTEEKGRGRGNHGGVALLTNEPDLAGLFERQGEVVPGVSPSGADSELRPSPMTGLPSMKKPFDCWQELLRSA